MEDFRLRVFVTAAQTLNFSQCAQLLGISQPAVSIHIKELEKHYGVILFERKQTVLELTAYGRILYQAAEDILFGYEMMEYRMQIKTASLTVGQFTLAISSALDLDILNPILSEYRQLTEKELQIKIGNASDVELWLLEGSADIALTDRVSDDQQELEILGRGAQPPHSFLILTRHSSVSDFHKAFARTVNGIINHHKGRI